MVVVPIHDTRKKESVVITYVGLFFLASTNLGPTNDWNCTTCLLNDVAHIN